MVCTTMLKTMKNNAMNIGMDNLKSFEIQQKKKKNGARKFKNTTSFARLKSRNFKLFSVILKS